MRNSILERLNKVNDVPVRSVEDKAFLTYGRILTGYDFSELIEYMERYTAIPESGNVYTASVPEMELCSAKKHIEATVYGGMPVQIGYCNGRNETCNGFEYHKGSELNIAVTDFMLMLGHSYDIKDNSYDVSQAEVFYVPRGCLIEMYQTTLHLSPLRVCTEGFKDIVILPRGTNTPFEKTECGGDPEQRLLLQRNKWVIAHPEREPLIRQGAYPGVTGENKRLYF